MSDEARRIECDKLNRAEVADLALEEMRQENRGPFFSVERAQFTKKQYRTRQAKSRIANYLTTQRDQLQNAYDWNTAYLDDEGVSDLHNLIQLMGQIISRLKQ